MMNDELYFLQREGFRIAVIVSGHGGLEHLDVLRKLADRWRNAPMKVVLWRDNTRPPAELQFPGSGGHADFSEASSAGGVDPKLVDVERFGSAKRDQAIGLKKENAGKIDIEKGKRLLDWKAEQMAKAIGEMYTQLPKAEPVDPMKPMLGTYLP
jgi:creatinine amidohydrolase/Fe(II)-dependent formamide hydrolase-like protein